MLIFDRSMKLCLVLDLGREMKGNSKTQIKITYFHINETITALRTLSCKSSCCLLEQYFSDSTLLKITKLQIEIY